MYENMVFRVRTDKNNRNHIPIWKCWSSTLFLDFDVASHLPVVFGYREQSAKRIHRHITLSSATSRCSAFGSTVFISFPTRYTLSRTRSTYRFFPDRIFLDGTPWSMSPLSSEQDINLLLVIFAIQSPVSSVQVLRFLVVTYPPLLLRVGNTVHN